MLPQGVAGPMSGNAGYRSHSRPEVMKFLPSELSGLRILEVGCGEGAFSAPLQARNEVWGIEPYEPSATAAKPLLSRVFAATFEAAKTELPLNYFDLVFCNDVIEHMTDHDTFLRSIQDHMTSGASIVGSVPNVRHYKNLFNLLFLADWHYTDWGTLDHTHFRFFTMRSWRRSLEAAGFNVERLEGLNGNIYFNGSRWDVAYNVFTYGVIGLTAGRARDVRFLQIGFRASLPAQKQAPSSLS